MYILPYYNSKLEAALSFRSRMDGRVALNTGLEGTTLLKLPLPLPVPNKLLLLLREDDSPGAGDILDASMGLAIVLLLPVLLLVREFLYSTIASNKSSMWTTSFNGSCSLVGLAFPCLFPCNVYLSILFLAILALT